MSMAATKPHTVLRLAANRAQSHSARARILQLPWSYIPVPLQERHLRALWEEHGRKSDSLPLIAATLSGGFSKGQIGSQLRKLGLVQGKHKRGGGGAARRLNQVGTGVSLQLSWQADGCAAVLGARQQRSRVLLPLRTCQLTTGLY